MSEQRDTLLDIARAAHEEREQERAAASARRREEERQRAEVEDAEALELALQSPITEWFPGVVWELIDRNFGQQQVVLRDPESGLHFKVHPTRDDRSEWGVDLVSPNPRGNYGGKYDIDVAWAKSPADIGRWLAKRDQHRADRLIALAADGAP